MSTGNNQQAAPQTERKQVATQKIFRFKTSTKPEVIDKTVNDWLLKMALTSTPAMLGKTYSSGGLFNRYVYIVYMYTRFVNVPKTAAAPAPPLKKA